mgnify:CR=1 FL=1
MNNINEATFRSNPKSQLTLSKTGLKHKKLNRFKDLVFRYLGDEHEFYKFITNAPITVQYNGILINEEGRIQDFIFSKEWFQSGYYEEDTAMKLPKTFQVYVGVNESNVIKGYLIMVPDKTSPLFRHIISTNFKQERVSVGNDAESILATAFNWQKVNDKMSLNVQHDGRPIKISDFITSEFSAEDIEIIPDFTKFDLDAIIQDEKYGIEVKKYDSEKALQKGVMLAEFSAVKDPSTIITLIKALRIDFFTKQELSNKKLISVIFNKQLTEDNKVVYEDFLIEKSKQLYNKFTSETRAKVKDILEDIISEIRRKFNEKIEILINKINDNSDLYDIQKDVLGTYFYNKSDPAKGFLVKTTDLSFYFNLLNAHWGFNRITLMMKLAPYYNKYKYVITNPGEVRINKEPKGNFILEDDEFYENYTFTKVGNFYYWIKK